MSTKVVFFFFFLSWRRERERERERRKKTKKLFFFFLPLREEGKKAPKLMSFPIRVERASLRKKELKQVACFI